MVDEPDLGRLVQLVLQASDDATRTQAAEALNQACQRLTLKHGSINAKPLLQGAVSGPSEARIALLPICSGLINPDVRIALRSAIQDAIRKSPPPPSALSVKL